LDAARARRVASPFYREFNLAHAEKLATTYRIEILDSHSDWCHTTLVFDRPAAY
jgi:hypothetical protein